MMNRPSIYVTEIGFSMTFFQMKNAFFIYIYFFININFLIDVVVSYSVDKTGQKKLSLRNNIKMDIYCKSIKRIYLIEF